MHNGTLSVHYSSLYTYSYPGYLLDPHTAVAKTIADAMNTGEAPMLISSTAHYGKFGDAVLRAIEETDGVDLDSPESVFTKMADLNARPLMHRALVDSVLKPRRHHKVLEPSLPSIIAEIQEFASWGVR